MGIDCNPPVVPPSDLKYQGSPFVFYVGQTPAQAVPSFVGKVDSFTIQPSLPAGLALNNLTGAITGTPTAAFPGTDYLVTAGNSAGSTSATIKIEVRGAPSGLSYQGSPYAFYATETIVPLTPSFSGMVTEFSSSPQLPTGMTIDATTGVISGAPAIATDNLVYTIFATNPAGSAAFDLYIEILPRKAEIFTGLSVSPSSTSAKVGDMVQLNAQCWYLDGHAEGCTTGVVWFCAQAAVAVVDGSGKLTAIGVGQAQIVASLGGKTSNQAVVDVTPKFTYDFGISAISLQTTPVYKNDLVTMLVDVKNNGAGRVDGAQIVLDVIMKKDGIRMGETFSTSSSPATIEPGGVWTMAMGLFWHPEPGLYEASAGISLGGSMYGKDEDPSDDQMTFSFQVLDQRRPGTNSDLAFQNIDIEDLGASHRLTFDIVNIGADPKTCNFDTKVWATAHTSTRTPYSQEQLVLTASSQMAPGASKSFVFNIVDGSTGKRLPRGEYAVDLRVNNEYGSFCEESDMNNNGTTVTLMVDCSSHEECQEPPADFGIAAIALQTSPAYKNDLVTMLVDVKNNGAGRVDGAQIVLDVIMKKDGVRMGESFSTSSWPSTIEPGGVWTIVMGLFWHPEPGLYEAAATISFGGSMYGKDSDPSNNQMTFTFQVLDERRPGTNSDLVYQNVGIEDLGTSHRLALEIKNVGTDAKTCVFDTVVRVTVVKDTQTYFQGQQVVLAGGALMEPGTVKSFAFNIVDGSTGGRLPTGGYKVTLGVTNIYGSTCEELDLNNNGMTVDLDVE